MIEGQLKTTGNNLKGFRSKISSIPLNVKAQGIISNFNKIDSEFSVFEERYKSSNQDYGKEEYLTAKEKIKSIPISSIEHIGKIIDSLDIELGNVLKQHDKITKEIESTSLSMTNFPLELTSFLGKSSEIELIEKNLNTVIEEFNSGKFEDYSSLNSDIQEIKRNLALKESSFIQELNKIVSLGLQLVDKEHDRLCNEFGRCNEKPKSNMDSTSELEDVESICKTINEEILTIYNQANE